MLCSRKYLLGRRLDRELPEGLFVAMLRPFLRSPTAAYSGLGSASPAATAELERLADQMRAYARVR